MMKVEICRLGRFNHQVNWKRIERWSSKYFQVAAISIVSDIDVDHFSDGYVYPTKSIYKDMGKPRPGTDLLVAVVDQPLEGDFYMHRIDSKSAVISVFPVLSVLRQAHIPLENYLLRCIYEMVVFAYEGGGKVDKNIYLKPHHETRGCLFDMNVFVDRIVFSCNRPEICEECRSRLHKAPLPPGFVNTIAAELKGIKNPLYYRIEEQVKAHPIFALVLAALFGIALNVAASFVYDAAKSQQDQAHRLTSDSADAHRAREVAQ